MRKHTLKEETFAGRNFCGFAVFGRIRKSLFPRNVTKVVNRKSLFRQKNRFFHNFTLIEENYSEPKEETILGSFLAPTTNESIEASK